MDALFGPAGNSQEFYDSGFSATISAPEFLHQKGLTAYEYQCGRGVRVSEKTALPLKKNAEKYGVALSLHAPYYISLASKEEEKRENSIRYIMESARAADLMGAARIVVHPGGVGKMTREDAFALGKETLGRALEQLRDEGLSHITVCPETMGKVGQLGDLEEVLGFCLLSEQCVPCIDFGHLNARTQGGLPSKEAFAAVLGRIADVLGEERARRFHSHFSKIEYSRGGEVRHLTFEDTVFGPDYEPLLELVYAKNASPVFICESAGTQSQDAAAMKQYYDSLREG